MVQGFALVMDLLYWTMLAASTVGPGTIIMMAKSGAEFQLKLAWVVIPASIIAYVTQEGAARLFIVSGLDFGGAIQTYFKSPVINYGLACTIVLANCALEAGQVVGALEAMYVIYRDEALFRILMAALFGVTVAAILLKGNVDMISKALGTVVVVMVVTFSIGAAQTGANGKELAEGLFVPQLGTEEIPVAISMIATTALPFNFFLASSLAKGYSVPDMQRGILFSTSLAAVLSLTIIIVGSGVDTGSSGSFAVKDITSTLKRRIGPSGSGLFVFGLFFASFSSALTIALGAACTCQSLLGAPVFDLPDSIDDDLISTRRQKSSLKAAMQSQPPQCPWSSEGSRFKGVILGVISVGTAVGASGMSTVGIVFVSQLIGGVVLPIVATFLMLVLCADDFMRPARQSWVEQSGMVFACTMAVYMASILLLKTAFLAFIATALYLVMLGGYTYRMYLHRQPPEGYTDDGFRQGSDYVEMTAINE